MAFHDSTICLVLSCLMVKQRVKAIALVEIVVR